MKKVELLLRGIQGLFAMLGIPVLAGLLMRILLIHLVLGLAVGTVAKINVLGLLTYPSLYFLLFCVCLPCPLLDCSRIQSVWSMLAVMYFFLRAVLISRMLTTNKRKIPYPCTQPNIPVQILGSFVDCIPLASLHCSLCIISLCSISHCALLVCRVSHDPV